MTLKRPTRSLFKKRDPRINERNYYRILGVQVDAPDQIIESSYKALRGKADIDHELVEEALRRHRRRRACALSRSQQG